VHALKISAGLALGLVLGLAAGFFLGYLLADSDGCGAECWGGSVWVIATLAGLPEVNFNPPASTQFVELVGDCRRIKNRDAEQGGTRRFHQVS
jgi:hypothetical protein